MRPSCRGGRSTHLAGTSANKDLLVALVGWPGGTCLCHGTLAAPTAELAGDWRTADTVRHSRALLGLWDRRLRRVTTGDGAAAAGEGCAVLRASLAGEVAPSLPSELGGSAFPLQHTMGRMTHQYSPLLRGVHSRLQVPTLEYSRAG